MKHGVNMVILIGNIGQDPESRCFPDGNAITTCSLATSESWVDKKTGEKQEATEWHRLVFKDRGAYRLGQIAADHLEKGSKIYVQGSLKTRKWQAQDGTDRHSTEVVVEEFQFLGPKPEGSAPRETSRKPANKPAPVREPPEFDFDEDLPF